MKKYITVIASLSALILSIVALCFAAYRTPDLSFDYMGVIVGVLALLITALIGYNIYSLIDLRRIQNQYDNLISEVINMKNDVVTKAESIDGMISTSLVTYGAVTEIFEYLMKEEKWFVENYILSNLSIAYLCSLNNNLFDCSNSIQLILNNVDPETLTVEKISQTSMFNIAEQIMHKDKITNYADLLCFIAKINTKKDS